jgi:soluble lytic murein transglycosylase
MRFIIMKYKLLRTFLLIVLLLCLTITIVKKVYPNKYSSEITKYSKQYGVDPILVKAVIKAESNFRPGVKSSKNAYGLMQITPATAEWVGKEMKIDSFSLDKLYDPDFNIKMGCWYLSNLNEQFNGSVDLVLAAYNGGPGNVQKWLNDKEHSKDGKNLHYIPFKETDKYVKKVKVNYNIYKLLYSKK